MPTPRQRTIVDRLIDGALGREPRGHERALLEAAQPPLWVRLSFITISVGSLAGLLLSAFDKLRWLGLPWDDAGFPMWLVFFGLIAVTQFTYREVHRQYGKRALGEDTTSQ